MNARVSLLLALLVGAAAFAVLPFAQAAVPLPYNLYGTGRDAAFLPLPLGTPIRAFIDGVEYSNRTAVYDASGSFDIDVFGNEVTNLTSPNTPQIKEGGDQGDPILFATGDLATAGAVFREAYAWTTGTFENGNLTLADPGRQPRLLKINNLTVQPFDGGNPYLYLYNPTGEPVNLSAYYLQANVPGDYFGPAEPVARAEDPALEPGQYRYVELAAIPLEPTGDALKLVWTNPGGVGAPFGGADVVVDRVEYNATVGGTLSWEPGNTIMPDAPAPGRGEELRRAKDGVPAPGADTNDNAADFVLAAETGRFGLVNVAPNPPRGLAVDGFGEGTDGAFHVVDHTPLLNWTHDDPNGGPPSGRHVQVSTEPNAGGVVVWDFNDTDLVVNESVVYGGDPLLDGATYYLRVKTRDNGGLWGDWAEMAFRMNTAPPAPRLTSPPNGVRDGDYADVVLEWTAEPDADGDALTFVWFVRGTSPVDVVGAFNRTGTTTGTRSPPLRLAPATDLVWYVHATDGWETTASSTRTYGTRPDVNPPRADPGGPYRVGVGEVFLLDGSNSTDDSFVAAWNWTLRDGDGNVVFQGEGPQVPVRLERPGTYVVSLEVTDAGGNTDREDTTVEVVEPFPAVLVIAVVAVLLAAIALGFVAYRRRKGRPPPPEATPPPPEEEPPKPY
jgi:hypothetical protein